MHWSWLEAILDEAANVCCSFLKDEKGVHGEWCLWRAGWCLGKGRWVGPRAEGIGTRCRSKCKEERRGTDGFLGKLLFLCAVTSRAALRRRKWGREARRAGHAGTRERQHVPRPESPLENMNLKWGRPQLSVVVVDVSVLWHEFNHKTLLSGILPAYGSMHHL